jgi:hypothetical protein
MNILNFKNIVGQNTNVFIIILYYILPIFIVSVSFGIKQSNTLGIFIFSLVIFILLIVVFFFDKDNILSVSGGNGFLGKIGSSIDELGSKIGELTPDLSSGMCLPITYLTFIGIFVYLLISFTILFNTNSKKKTKYFFFNLFIQYSLLINLLLFIYVPNRG